MSTREELKAALDSALDRHKIASDVLEQAHNEYVAITKTVFSLNNQIHDLKESSCLGATSTNCSAPVAIGVAHSKSS